MYALSVVLGSASIAFLYTTEEGAEAAYQKLIGPNLPKHALAETVHIKDDFGQIASFRAANIHGIVLENYDLSKAARAEQLLHMNRAQNLASRVATGDPGLRMGSPPLMMPMGNGPLPR